MLAARSSFLRVDGPAAIRRVAASLLLAAVELHAAETSISATASEMRRLFEASCVECHSDDGTAKGDFDYVLDFARMAANPKLVVHGRPGESELYRLIRDDKMPGPESRYGNFSPAEKAVVARWIEQGTRDPAAPFSIGETTAPQASPPARPTPALPQRVPPGAAIVESFDETAAVHLPSDEDLALTRESTVKYSPPPRPQRPALDRTLRLMGQFHAAAVHFPVALLVVAAGLSLTAQKSAGVACLRTAAWLSPLAVATGWWHADYASYTEKSALLLAWHRWLGVATSVVAVAAAFLAKRGGAAYHLTLWLGALSAIVVGALGGGLAHGFSHYRW